MAAKCAFPYVRPMVLCRLPAVMLQSVSDRVAPSVVLRVKRMTQTGVLLPCSVSLMAVLSGALMHLQASGIGCLVLAIVLIAWFARCLSSDAMVEMLLSAVSTSRNRAPGSVSSGIR